MLLRSLICLRGYDQGLRHLAIALACYALILLCWGVTLSAGVATVICIIALPLLLASSWRRVRDAQRPPLLTVTALLPWLLMLSATATATTGAVLYCAVILAMLLHVGLSLLPPATSSGAKVQRRYVQGYCGPVDLTMAQSTVRVEPTIDGQVLNQGVSAVVSDTGDTTVSHAASPHVVGDSDACHRSDGFVELQQNLQQLLQWCVRHKLTLLIAIVVLVIASLVATWLMQGDAEATQQHTDDEAAAAVTTTQPQREVVKLPDHFSLALADKQLFIQWLGDTMTPGPMWDLATAKGDQRCADIVFNDGSRYRPMQVNIIANGAVEANFSPLDAKKIVNDVAMRGSFSLCGYDFSLKGSQAALQANARFNRLLN